MSPPLKVEAANLLLPPGILRIADNLQIVVSSASSFELRLGPVRYCAGPRTLEILHAFTTPRSASDAIASLGAKVNGVQDWMLLTSSIVSLARGGFLVDVDQAAEKPSFSSSSSSFDAAPIHIAMLDDQHRTRCFLDAIASRVRPGDVVVDLGTGSGVLAVAAAKAGAARVYAVEETRIGDIARQVFQANGVADRIHLLEGHSTQLHLPEQADVLVTEIIGNDPFGERVLESMGDAVARWLKPDARLIPQHLSVYAAPVQIAVTALDRWRVGPRAVRRWQDFYGIDFSPLAVAAGVSPVTAYVSAKDLSTWELLAPPVLAFDCALHQKLHAKNGVELEFELDRDGRCDGIALWFSLDLGAEIHLATDPRDARQDNHWRNPIWCLGRSLALVRGQRIRLSLSERSSARDLRVSVVEPREQE
jgi:precorrin-6B methylase 2